MDFFSSRSNNDITELSWENGQPLKHEHVGILPTFQTSKTTWGSTDNTLESIVHLATCQNLNIPEFDYQPNHHQSFGNKNSTIATTAIGKRGENSRNIEINHPRHANKRVWSSEYSDQCKDMKNMRNVQQARADRRSCGSASATFCSDNDTTMVTQASFESHRSLKTNSVNGDSTFHPGSENPYAELENKGDTFQFRPSRRSRVAAIHNQSERKRRDRINEKIKTLQKLVPNANKTDKASMLDEVIDHLKQLQEQVRIMSTRNIPQMMMPLEMQQQLHMSHFERMAMGASLGMCMGPMHDIINLAQSASQPLSSLIHQNSATTAITPTFIPPQFSLPAVIPRHIQPQASAIQGSTNSNHAPYSALLAQSMNMELYNKMAAAIYQQQVKQAGQTTNDTSNLKHVQGE